MKIKFDLTETEWEVDFHAILKSIDTLGQKEAGKEPLTPEKMALHLFKLGIQAYKKEASEGGMGYVDVVSRAHAVNTISGMVQKLIDLYRKHNALAEVLRKKLKDPGKAFQAVKGGLLAIEKNVGEEAVKLFQQEIFLSGIASVFPELDEVIGQPASKEMKEAAKTPWNDNGKKPKKKRTNRS